MLSVSGLEKSFGEKAVLSHFSCVFEENAYTGIMGPSGCGKTTLMRVLMGLEKPDAGTLTGFAGKKRSAVFQEDRLCENLSPAANVRLVCPQRKQEEIIRAFAAVGLPGQMRQPVRELSGGMKRRVAIVRALLADFEALFLDEPMKGLDEKNREATVAFLQEKTVGKTVFIVSHDQKELLQMGVKAFLICGENGKWNMTAHRGGGLPGAW